MKQNLLLIVSDALRADHLGCYGSPRGNSPTLDALSKQGVIFENAFTVSPVTNVSISTLFTGQLPKTHGVRRHTALLSGGIPTLAEQLQAEGYQTGAVVSCATLDRSRGLSRGFDFYDDEFGPEEPKGIKPPDPDERTVARHAGTAISRAIQWLQGLDPERPVFLFLHLFDTHSPYDPTREYRQTHPVSYSGPVDGSEREGLEIKQGTFLPSPEDIEYLHYLVGGELHHTDQQVARLLKALETEHRANDLLTIFTADHGVHLGEAGVWGSGRRLYDRELHIPLIFHGLAEGAGTRFSPLILNTDVMPTVLEALGLSLPEGLTGHSRLPELLNPDAADNAVIYAETFMPAAEENQRVAVRNHRWKLIAPVPEDNRETKAVAGHAFKEQWQRIQRLLYRLIHNRTGRRQQFKRALGVLFGSKEKDAYQQIEKRDRELLGTEPELFDIQKDPEERNNLYAARPRVAKLMENELSFYSNRYIRSNQDLDQLSDEQLRDANEVLRQLGYK